MELTPKIILVKEKHAFPSSKYGIYGNRLWPLLGHQAQYVLNSLRYFNGKTVPDYFANCGLEISGIINRFYHGQEQDCPDDLETYLEETEPSYKQATLWRAKDLESYFSDKNIDWDEINLVDMQKDMQRFQRKIDKYFKDWTLTEVILSAYFSLFIYRKDPSLGEVLDYLKICHDAGPSGRNRESIQAKLKSGDIPGAASEYCSKGTYDFINSQKRINEGIESYCKDIFKNFIFNPHLRRIFTPVEYTSLYEESCYLWKVLREEYSANKTFENQILFSFKDFVRYLWIEEGDYLSEEDKLLWGFDNEQDYQAFKDFRKSRIVFTIENILPESIRESFLTSSENERDAICENYEALENFLNKAT